MALTAIASCGDGACYRIISPHPNLSGIALITTSTETHLTDKNVCEEFVLFIDEMLEEEDIQGTNFKYILIYKF